MMIVNSTFFGIVMQGATWPVSNFLNRNMKEAATPSMVWVLEFEVIIEPVHDKAGEVLTWVERRSIVGGNLSGQWSQFGSGSFHKTAKVRFTSDAQRNSQKE